MSGSGELVSSEQLANDDMSLECKHQIGVPTDFRWFHTQQSMLVVLHKLVDRSFPISWDTPSGNGKKWYGICSSKEDLFRKLLEKRAEERHCY